MSARKLFLSLLVLISFILPPTVFAAYPIENIETDPSRKDFVVGPGKQEIFLKPGQSATVEISVSNRMGEERLFELNVEDFKGSKDINKVVEFLGEENGPFSLKNYIKFPEKSFTLSNGTRAKIPVTIKVPANAEPGGLYGTLFISTVKSPEQVITQKDSATSGVPINIRQGVLFFVRVEGDAKEDGKVTDFRIINGRSLFDNNEDIDFVLIYENNGSVHLNPSGKISVSNFAGQEISELELEPWFTMPDSIRSREKKMNTGMMAGRYTAQAHIYRGFGALDDPSSYNDLILNFWVIPWSKIVWGSIIVLLIAFAVIWIGKNFEFRRKR